MAGRVFDANVLIYLTSREPVKASRVRELINSGGVISVQVLNEVAAAARRKVGLTWLETRDFLFLVRAFLAVVPVTSTLHETGLRLAERYGFSVYDAMIAAAALGCGCDTLWSEDMHDGLVIDGRTTVVNPFRRGVPR